MKYLFEISLGCALAILLFLLIAGVIGMTKSRNEQFKMVPKVSAFEVETKERLGNETTVLIFRHKQTGKRFIWSFNGTVLELK